MVRYLLASLFLMTLPAAVPAAETSLSIPPPEKQILIRETPVQVEKPLFDCLKELPTHKVLTLEGLNQKSFNRLKDVSRSVAGQRETMLEFEGYVKWMGGAIAGYSKYVEAGSFAAGFAKLLPIPYAGQAGQLSKFISHFALSLSGTSAAVKQYLSTSQMFVTRVEALGGAGKGREAEIAALTFYADQQLSRDMLDLQGRLAATSELSTSALSFLVSLQQYLGTTDEYWQKTKSLVIRKEADRAEKGALAGSINGLKSKAEVFNINLKVYSETISRITPIIAALVAYDELRQDMDQ